MKIEEIYIKGAKLTPSEANGIENMLSKNLDDVDIRMLLTVYYSIHMNESDKHVKSFIQNIEWFEKKHPGSVFLNLQYAVMGATDKSELISNGIINWGVVKEYITSPVTLETTASWFDHNGGETIGELLYERMYAKDPDSAKTGCDYAFYYAMKAQGAKGEEKRIFSGRAISAYEKALTLDNPKDRIMHILVRLAQVFFDSGRFAEARERAERLLIDAYKQDDNMNETQKRHKYGLEIHRANIILGRIELCAGNIEKAKAYLLESARDIDAPVLSSFGPRFSLAEELFDKGEYDVILQYLDLCQVFWHKGKVLDLWRSQIKAGKKPEFWKTYIINEKNELEDASGSFSPRQYPHFS